MKIVIKSYNNTGDFKSPIILNFELQIPINNSTFYSLDGLMILKDISKEIIGYLGIDPHTQINPGIEITTVYVHDYEYNKIKTIVKRDNIIENILKI